MIRLVIARGLALMAMTSLVIVAVLVAPLIAHRVPSAISAVKHEVAVLAADLKLNPHSSAHQQSSVEHPRPTTSPTSTPPMPSEQAGWRAVSHNNCVWAEGTLTTDSTLDLEAATEFPSWESWYTTVASWWVQAQSVVKGLCGQGPVPTSLDCQQAMGHFATARATHEAALNGQDQLGEPGTLASDRSWNEAWAGYYTRLTDIVAQTGCGAAAG